MSKFNILNPKEGAYLLKHKLWRVKYSEMINTGKAPLPNKIIIEATLRCNLSCHFCFRDLARFKELTTTELKKIIDNLGPSVKRVGLTGGEIFLRPDIFEIFDYILQKKLSLGVLSNATLLNEERIERLVKYKEINIGISLDGLEETHNKIRGRNAFEKTLKAIKGINKRMRIGVNTVITNNNIDEILPLFKMISPYIHSYSVEFEMFNNKQEVVSSSGFLGISPEKITTWVTEKAGYDYEKEKISFVLGQLKKLAKQKGIYFAPEPVVVDTLFSDFYDGKILKKQPLCGHLFTARCDPNGALVFCHLVKTEYGNLVNTPLPELWNSVELKDIRKRLLKKYMPSICKRCCRLA